MTQLAGTARRPGAACHQEERYLSSCSGTRTSISAPTPGTPVDDQDYQVPFTFNGKLNKLTLTIDRPQLTPADIEKPKAGQMAATSAKE